MVLKHLPNWEITLSEHIDITAGSEDPVLAKSLVIIKEQCGLEYHDLDITLNSEGFAVIKPKQNKG